MDTQRRTLLAILICVLIWFVYAWINPPPENPSRDESKTAAVEKKSASDDAPAQDEDADEAADPVADDGSSPVSTVERKTGRLENELVAFDVTNAGGLLERVEMRSPQFLDESGKGLDLLGNRKPTLTIGFDRGEDGEGTDFRFKRDTVWEVLESDQANEWKLRHQTAEVEVVATLTLGVAYEGLLKVRVANKTGETQRHRLALGSEFALPEEASRYDIHRGMCSTGEDVEDFSVDDVEDETGRVKGRVHWMALDSKYFVSALVPENLDASSCAISTNESQNALFGRLTFATEELGPNEAETYTIGLYFGTKEIERLETYSTVAGAHLEGSIDWGWFGALNRTLGKLMLRLLRWFYSLTGIWGVAILLLTVVVKAITLPLTLKQMNSMKRMKEIQPKIEEIKEKYGDDRVRQGQEMQALFQRSGVNPLAGCLPLVIQMPIWIALYAMLGTVVELYREPFLWLPDLTGPDPYFILPLAMGALMFLQTRLQPAMDSQQARMMSIMMPGIFTVMMLFLPSGLGVYIFANVVLSLIQTVIQVRPGKPAAAAES
ncbi:MAG: membrane protein insertase YidC [Myxococcales bacterium]|nr:membrane protein insertase YidC [Myxococcales bacterium]MCB9750299.1 membrane protein insertase YidC [Myxococcales bacterium]